MTAIRRRPYSTPRNSVMDERRCTCGHPNYRHSSAHRPVGLTRTFCHDCRCRHYWPGYMKISQQFAVDARGAGCQQ